MKQKKIAVINDLSGYGRCSLTVSIPIISAMKIQCCPVPTSILSNHTGYPHFYFDDYTEKLPEYISHWKKLGLKFDGIYSGYLGSVQQIEIVADFFKYFKEKETAVLIDPIMGDHGVIYQNFGADMCREMKKLICYADIVTPNLTEACILAEIPYRESGWKKEELQELADNLHDLGPEKVVITGIHQGAYVANFLSEGKGGAQRKLLRTRLADQERPGTGDVFASILAADMVKGTSLENSVRKASSFVKKCILRSAELDIAVQDGVCLEEFLTSLK